MKPLRTQCLPHSCLCRGLVCRATCLHAKGCQRGSATSAPRVSCTCTCKRLAKETWLTPSLTSPVSVSPFEESGGREIFGHVRNTPKALQPHPQPQLNQPTQLVPSPAQPLTHPPHPLAPAPLGRRVVCHATALGCHLVPVHGLVGGLPVQQGPLIPLLQEVCVGSMR